MKKQKQPSITEPKASAEHELALLIYDSKDGAYAGHILQKLSGSRHELQVYIITSNEAQTLGQQHVAEYVTKGKCLVGSRYDIAQAMTESQINWYVAIDKDNEDYLAQIIGFFSGNRKQFQQESVYTAIINKSSGKEKEGFLNKLKFKFYNVFAQLLTPTPEADLTLPFRYFPKSIITALLPGAADTSATLAASASYNQFAFSSIALTPKEVNARRLNLGYVWRNAFAARINWFVKDAVKSDWWRPAYFGLVIIAFFGMLLMSQQYGMTWDEKRHNDYSKESLKYFETFGEDTTCLSETLPTQEFRYYGEHFNVVAAFLYSHVLPLGEFETRHLLNALYGFLAMLFASLLAKEIGSWRMAFMAFLMIVLSPVFFGHSMNNPTDIPFALGFSMALYYLIKVFRTLPQPKTSHILMAAMGVGIAVGSRVGGVLLYAYAGMYLGVHFLMHFKTSGFKNFKHYVRVFVILLFAGHVLSIWIWPFGQQHFFTSWYEALKKSTEGAFFTYNHELFEGVRMYMANVPWYYLPKFILINTPLVVLAGFALAVLSVIFWKKFYGKDWVVVAFVVFALIFPIVYAEYQSMYYYNGWRHYLFIYPPLIILASTGWESVMRMLKKPAVAQVVLFVVMTLCLLPGYWMVKNHPNDVVYFNELTGGIKGAYGKYETDYYSNSCRAAGEWIAQQEPNKKLLVAINNEPMTAAYYAQKINPNLEFKWVREYEEQKPFWDYAIFTSRTYSQNELLNGSFPPKGTVHIIEADGVPLAVIVKREDYNMPLGYSALDKKNWDSAVYYFTKATEYNPKDEETWRMLGEAYMNRMSGDTALMMLNKSIALAPDNYSAYNDLGQVYMNLKKDNSNAIKNFQKSTALKYNYAEGYYYEASCYMAMQDYNHAITVLENGIKRGGNSIPEMYYNLGVCYLYSGLNKKAEENFINCLTLTPNFAMGYRALAEAFSKQNKTGEAEQCMAKYRQLGGQ